jgi:hypothetical protein
MSGKTRLLTSFGSPGCRINFVFILGSARTFHNPAQLGWGEKEDAMRIVTKAVLAALAMTGPAIAVSAPAKAQVSAYAGIDGGDPYYGGSYQSAPYADPYYADQYAYEDGYADPYACDYYNPPWGYPPDYCAYQVWQEPIYFGGLWYSGPIYYRSFGRERLFWLNGGWRHDEWRGARPSRIDWSRNMRWNGPVQHRGGFAGGGNFAGRNASGGANFNRGRTSGQNFNGQSFATPQNGGPGGGFQGRFSGGTFQGRIGRGQGFVQPSNAAPNSGRVFGHMAERGGEGAGFTRSGNASGNDGVVRGRFGGQSFPSGRQSGGPRAGVSGGGGFRGGDHGGHGGEGRHGR